jgi:hypothetical protein
MPGALQYSALRRAKAIRHVVHEYANFVSSSEIVITGSHRSRGLDSPINHHVAHALFLNCRKLREFFSPSNPAKNPQDITTAHYVTTNDL